MNKANECTCPSGDGSLVHPCPAHPAVEQEGGDERAAFELFVRKHCGMPEHIAVNWDAKFTNDAWEGWQARAALAQPSPAQAEQPTADDYEEVLADHRRLVREMDVLLNGEAYAAKQAMLCDLVSQVEAEVRKSGQPLLVSAERYRWLRNDDNWGADDSEGQGTSKWANLGELSGTDFDAYLDQLRGSNPGSSRGIHRPLDVSEHYTIPLYAAPVAQAGQVPAAWYYDAPSQAEAAIIDIRGMWGEDDCPTYEDVAAALRRLLAAAPAQAQHSVPEGWMLVECGIWTQEQVDEMQKTVTRFRNSEFVDDRALAMAVADAGQCKAPEISLAELLAAAPGKEGV